MLDELDIQIITTVKKHGSLLTNDFVKKLSIKRTSLNYHLDKLIEAGFLEKERKGRSTLYVLASLGKMQSFFEKERKALEEMQQQIVTVSKKKIHGKKLNLAFTNYYDLLPPYRKELQEYYNIIDFSDTELYISNDEFLFRANDADVVMHNAGCKVTSELVEKLPQLQYLHTSTFMYRYVDTEYLRQKGLHFSHLFGEDYRSVSLAEYALAQTFALFRRASEARSQLQSGVNEFKYFMGEQLRGNVVGILGTDAISKDLYILLKNLGTEVLMYNEDPKVEPHNIGVSRFYSLKEIFENAEVVYSVTSTDELLSVTTNLDKNLLGHIVKPIYFISVSKHKDIDTKILREYLFKGLLKGLALDYGGEMEGITRKNSNIMYLPNVLLTPDIGWYTKHSVETMNKITNQCLISYAKGDYQYLLF